SYRPDFGHERWGYYGEYYTETDTVNYSYYQNGIYGSPGSGKSGNITFGLGNNFEMKVRNRKDTVTGEKKIVLLKRFDFSTSYNLAADSLNWSNLRITANTKLHKNVSLNFNASFDPYARDSSGVRINTFEWEKNKKIVRLKNATLSVSGSLKSQDFSQSKQDNEAQAAVPNYYYPYGLPEIPYADFDIPWNLSMNYRLGINNNYLAATQEYVKDISQTINLSGSFTLTSKWSLSSRLDYDISGKKFVYSSLGISRDLHCWAMSMTVVPFGQLKSYSFRIYIKSSVFQGVEYKKERSRYDY
ncbi:MAG: putative LPS assembly protein LptD, partial [Bacteroidota bacterium]|nr:putative LPS assembly protein LptD [Bacteroidota bacterium]